MIPHLTVLQMTGRFMQCALCRTDPETFVRDSKTDRRKSPLTADWYPPRGWAGTTDPGERSLMLVSLNPGHPTKVETDSWTRHGMVNPGCCSTLDAEHEFHAQMVLNHCTQAYVQPPRGRDYSFHRRSKDFARACLWIMGLPTDDWLRHCWFTDIFKCSTPNESGPRIPAGAFKACEPHIREEISYFKPKVIVAFGSGAQTRLGKLKLSNVVACPHPSPNNTRPPNPWRPVDDQGHDDRFREVARLANKPLDDAHWVRFLEFRTQLARAADR